MDADVDGVFLEVTHMKKGIACMLLAAFFFSSMEIAIKMTGVTYHPIQLNLLRFFIGGILLLPLAHRQNRHLPRRMPPREYLFFAATGFVCVVVSMTLFVLSLSFAAASTVAIVFSSNAFFAIVFASLWLHQPFGKLTVTALFACFFGLLLVVNPLHLTASKEGVLIALASAVSFALYSVMVKGHLKKSPYGGLIPTVYTFLFGSAELLVCIALTHVPKLALWLQGVGLGNHAHIPIFRGVHVEGLPLLLYISIFVSGIGYAAYALAIEYASVTVASVTFFVKPILAPLMAFVLLAERQPWLAMVGLVLVSVGSAAIVTDNLCQAHERPLPFVFDIDRWARAVQHRRFH